MNMIKFAIASISFTAISAVATPPAWEPGGVPYEISEAGRTRDDHEPIVRFETAEGWKVRTERAVASLGTTTDHRLFGPSSLTLTYRADATADRIRNLPRVYVEPEQPIVLPKDFDTMSIWCYGNNNFGYAWVDHKKVEVPSSTLYACFDDGKGGTVDLELEHVNHCEWFLSIKFVMGEDLKRIRAGGNRLRSFCLRGGFNKEDQTICLTSFCAYKRVDAPLAFKPRAKRGVQIFKDEPQGVNTGDGCLPFPTTDRTMLPPAVEPDPRLEFRFPKNPALSWDDLAFRFEGGDWIPLAKDGGIYPVSARRNAQVKFRRDGNSVVAELVAKGGVAEEVRFGRLQYDGDIEAVPVPYLTYRKGYSSRPLVLSFAVKKTPLFMSAMFDWTQSAASEPFPATMQFAGGAAANGGVKYLPKTDGKRNDVYERLVWTVSPDFAATLPSIPNPVSPWKHVTGKGVWNAWGAGREREKDIENFVRFRRQGLRHLIITDHETMWRDGNESFTFKTNAAPVKGGDAAQLKHTRRMIDELGYRYGPYNNFTDYAPVNRHWNIDWVGRKSDGQLQHGWYRCYGPKPLRAVEACERLSPINQAKFKFNTAYCDVHTAVTPWTRTDYDARVPGAGTLAQVFYAYGEIMLLQKAAWNGPVYSEGGCQWPYWGLTDGNYAQDSNYQFDRNPWLVDFDLRECHPKACDFGMGNPSMFYGDGKEPKDKWEFEDRFLAATVAFGHPGFLVRNFDLVRHSYFMIQGVAARYTQAKATKIRYADRKGRFYDTTTAVANGAFRENRVAVRYDDGTVVVANGGRKESGDFIFRTPHGNVAIGPANWLVLAGDGQAMAISAPRAAETAEVSPLDMAFSDEYAYMHARGKFVMTAVGGTDGELIRDFLSSTEERVICREQKGEVVLPYVAKSMKSIGYNGLDNGDIEFTVKNGMTHFISRGANWEIRVERDAPEKLSAAAVLKSYVVQPDRKTNPGKEVEELTLPILVRSGMIIRGERPEPLDVSTGAKAMESNGLRSGGKNKCGYSMHPPYGGRAQGKTGAVFVEFGLTIPAEGQTVLEALVNKSDNSTPGDGIYYRVEASAGDCWKVLAERHVTEYCFEPISADLSEYCGQRIRIRLVADAGPANNPHGDGGGFAELRVVRKP